MRTSELFKDKKTLSFEVFPPKRTAPMDTIYRTLEGLKGLEPDFISVTYGAGGSENSKNTLEIARAIKSDHGIESVAHLPGIGLTRGDVLEFLRALEEAGIENILALRGDLNPDIKQDGDFKYASDLVEFINENGDFNVIGACYPEVHGEAASADEDIRALKRKVDAGTGHLVTQLFFDNRHFYDFMDRAAAVGIDVPVEAGIMPVTNRKQVERMVSLCGVDLPEKFVKIMERYERDPIALRDAGIAYAVDQIVDLVTQDVDGVHLYTMNNPYVAHRICEAVGSLMKA
ncbi:MAG: methylenetetrahydrofolate reductase [NAD(P)H] [Clostridiales Family XIII bacterium]|jgi:methylenetetrahydrofolate reductase (NADPH)|nr:methylenetetrahydrofolate reductase [NAD(P)H] [Clostridiales Family XIII bacterium]